jgi:O-antigen ligase
MTDETIKPLARPMRTWSEGVALALLLGHLVLLGCGGASYAKIRAFGPLYVTDVVLLSTAVLGWRSFFTVPWDRLTNLVVLFVAFGVCWVVAGGIGDTRGAGAKVFSFFVYSAFYFIVREIARDDETRWRVLHAIALATVGGALIGIVQTRTGVPLFDPSATFEVTTTGSTRSLGGDYAQYGLIAVCVPAIAVIVGRRLGWASMLVLLSAGVELVLAQHRSGFVSLGVALLAATTFVGGSAQTVRGVAKLLVIVTLAAALYVVVFGSSYLDATVDRVGETADFEDGNIAWRLNSWYEVLGGIVARPFGHGFSTWDFTFTSLDPLTGSHNDYLDLAYRIGVPGLVAFLALPVSLMRQTRALAQRTGPLSQLLPVTVCAAMVSFLVLAAFNVSIESPQVSILFWVLLGLGSGAVFDRQQSTLDAGRSTACRYPY